MEKANRDAQGEEFTNFVELAKKLLAVPKGELDKQREVDQLNKNKSTKPSE